MDYCVTSKPCAIVNKDVLSKQRDVSQMDRVINGLKQDSPPKKEWNGTLMNYKSKL